MRKAQPLLYTFLIIAASLSLSGCAPRQDNSLAQLQVAAMLANTNPVINKTAASGQTIQIVSQISANPDCTAGTPGLIRVSQQPAHGTATVSARSFYPSYPPNTPMAECNKSKLPGTILEYTPTRDFVGSDLMAFEVFTAGGANTREVKVLITVK